MKLITAFIKPFKLDQTREALINAGAKGISITEIKGFGRQFGHTELYRGAEYAVDFLPKIKLEVICTDLDKDRFVEAIIHENKEDRIGSGKITVMTIDEVIRIRTGEMDDDAI